MSLEARLVAAGLLDPDASDADERRTLLLGLVGRGLSVDEISAAHHDGVLPLDAIDRLIKGGKERLTVAEVAARTGLDTELVVRFWRADGFPDPGGARVFTDEDFDFPLFEVAAAALGEETVFQLVRVMGSSMARIAEAEVAAVVHRLIEARAPGRNDNLDLLSASLTLVDTLPTLAHFLDRLHRHHLESSIRRLLYVEGFAPNVDATEMTVGFSDLVGFTELSQRLTHHELAVLIEGFEATAYDVVVKNGGRLVKSIGDEVMFACGTPQAACRMALDLHGEVAAVESLPAIRTGIACGPVVVRDGDYHGTTVNLAARAVAVADPDEIFTTGAVRDAVNGERDFVPRGTYRLKGFADDIELFALQP